MKQSVRVLTLILFAFVVYGQDIEVTARVVDEITKKPIKNANVVVVETTHGTFTNALGYFKLTLSPLQRKLAISHVTYKTEPITVPEGVNSFTVPLRKAVYQLTAIDLNRYPNGFDSRNIKKKEKEITIGLDPNFIVERMADFEYEGGEKTFDVLFGNKFQYPEMALREKQEGRLLFGFTISTSGDYKDVGCFTDSSSIFCSELKRIISELPKWKPAEQRREAAEQTFAMIIYYGVNDYWKKKLKELKKQDR